MSASTSATGAPGAAPKKGDHVVLVGMPASGKTTIGSRLARRLGRRFCDTDEVVEQASGKSVPELFAEAGEEVFRSAERRALLEAIGAGSPSVISLGGGAVLDPANREAIATAGQVVWLRARTETLLARIEDPAGRPLLAGDPARALSRLAGERAHLYRQLRAVRVVEVDGRSVEEVVEAVSRALLRHVAVPLPGHPYGVLIGPGARHQLAALMPKGARRAVVVTQAEIPLEVETGLSSVRVEIRSGEKEKSMAAVEACCRAFVGAGLTRSDAVVAVGGGTVTDVAGFAASCYHRGTAVIHVPTTLLGQIDAAIGGKTGVNLPEGKNLVGAFWQPDAVICDTDALATLPEREWRSGLGEMAKYAFLGVEELDRLPLVEQIVSCVAEKAAVVAADERDGGLRMRLNYGHTLAHALEAIGLAESGSGSGTDLRHGEAVAIGIVFAARLAERLARIGPERVARHREVVRAYGLPEEIPAGADAEALLSAMGRDKKAAAGLTFVLDGPRGVEPVSPVEPALVREVLVELGARAPATTSPGRR